MGESSYCDYFPLRSARLSPLISTAQDTNLTLLTGAISSILLVSTSILSSTHIHPETAFQWMWFLSTIVGRHRPGRFATYDLCANRKLGFGWVGFVTVHIQRFQQYMDTVRFFRPS
jgi:hypothetical protein